MANSLIDIMHEQELMRDNNKRVFTSEMEKEILDFHRKDIENFTETRVDENSDSIQYYDPDSGEKPIKGKYCPPLNREFTCIDISNIPKKNMPYIIGKDGKVFKSITHNTGVDYIFWLKSQNLITIWGYHDLLPYALKRIQDRINYVNNGFIWPNN
jgi:hypothetical protein